ncbi:phosphate acetyl/butyryltransferase [Listeria grandensis FSL F6-0971]|uniref:Phosphate acetyl/butyryltransferase n=1 Tax=Listeria grandensis FSL F6-0971 TaxID=1265819 RepID=W7BJF8_9LIST|nr:phosphate acyltransferase [Listeria grandensis]EUJ24910.1 phosphate acetyl/butyryltransferase [Listeria grandensis FSL F6-0971]
MTRKSIFDPAGLRQKVTVAIAGADDPIILEVVEQALELGIANFLLFGRAEGISLRSPHVKIVATDSEQEAAEKATEAVVNKRADVLMKGNLPTGLILKTVLKREYELRERALLSHVSVFEIPAYDKPLIVSDVAMNIAPTEEEQIQITHNAIRVAQKLGIERPKVAILSAVEKENPKMRSSVQAAQVAAYFKAFPDGDSRVEGPLAFDNAISKTAALHKNIVNDVAGDADILIVPSIEAGNILYKSLVFFAGARVGGIIAGVKVPVIIASRSDSVDNKLASLILTVGMIGK